MTDALEQKWRAEFEAGWPQWDDPFVHWRTIASRTYLAACHARHKELQAVKAELRAELEAAVAEAVAAEREACAKACESVAEKCSRRVGVIAADDCADAIRARDTGEG